MHNTEVLLSRRMYQVVRDHLQPDNRHAQGVRKDRYAIEDRFDAWLLDLSPSAESVSKALAAQTGVEWHRFVRAFRSEMGELPRKRLLDLLAALSHDAHFSIGCYCKDESRCHRLVLRQLFSERGARLD